MVAEGDRVATATCPAGEKVLGGTGSISGTQNAGDLQQTHIDTQGTRFVGVATGQTNNTWSFHVQAVCAVIGG